MEIVKKLMNEKMNYFSFLKEVLTKELILEVTEELINYKYHWGGGCVYKGYTKPWGEYWSPSVSDGVNNECDGINNNLILEFPLPDEKGHPTSYKVVFDLGCHRCNAKFVYRGLDGITIEKEIKISEEFGYEMSHIEYNCYQKNKEWIEERKREAEDEL